MKNIFPCQIHKNEQQFIIFQEKLTNLNKINIWCFKYQIVNVFAKQE